MKQKTLIPLDFKVTPEIRLLAKAKGWPDPDEQREKFIDWHRAKGNKFLDLEAAFRGWLRYALEHGLAAPSRPTPGLAQTQIKGNKPHYNIEKSKKWLEDLKAELDKKTRMT